jgi:hypothetical protein
MERLHAIRIGESIGRWYRRYVRIEAHGIKYALRGATSLMLLLRFERCRWGLIPQKISGGEFKVHCFQE